MDEIHGVATVYHTVPPLAGRPGEERFRPIRRGATDEAGGRAVRTVATVRRIIALAKELGLLDGDLRIRLATFEVLAALRSVLLGIETGTDRDRLDALIPANCRAHPNGYRFPDLSARAPTARRHSTSLFRWCGGGGGGIARRNGGW